MTPAGKSELKDSLRRIVAALISIVVLFLFLPQPFQQTIQELIEYGIDPESTSSSSKP
ncbi:MAG: hypothetical protein HQM10_22205 [Candidatus Riflebacteria bacterium]|nr:hypothetical protein [Candidatus Riflebacteria bacterium]